MTFLSKSLATFATIVRNKLPFDDGDFLIQSVTATFTPGAGILSVFGNALDNNIVASRNAAGNILINGGAVPVLGGTPTVANTALIQMFGLGGDDRLTLDEANGRTRDAIGIVERCELRDANAVKKARRGWLGRLVGS